MKKLLTLLAMAMTAVCANAQAVIAEVDWTQEPDYYHDVYYTTGTISASVTHEGLVIEATPQEGASYWEAQIPIMAHIIELKEGGHYQVKLTVSSTVAGVLHLDLNCWDGLPVHQVLDIQEGLNELTVDFPECLMWGTDGMIMFQCGFLPGTFVITKVQLIDLDVQQDEDIIYNYDKGSKTAEVKGISKNHKAVIDIPETSVHDGEVYTVTKIGNNAFYECSDLISVNIPSSVTSIGSSAFMLCGSLISVNIPNSVTSIGMDAFHYCSSLVSLNLPNSVTRIGPYAFSSCSSLISLTIPGSVTQIDSHAFAGCTSLTSVNILSGTTRFSDFVFYGCGRISKVSIVVSDHSSFCRNAIVSQFKKEDSGLPITLLDTDGQEIKEFTVPSGVTSIGYGAFYNCRGLSSVTIPDGVTTIGDYAFTDCRGLTSLTIPNSVITIGEGAFSGCKGLTSLTLPENLSIIKKQTVYDCSSLESITIPASVEYIYQEAFANCQGLKQVMALPENPPFLFDNSFSNYQITLRVPEASKEKYMSTDPWRRFMSFKSLTDDDPDEQKCAEPTISYHHGKLTFYCETEDAVCQSTITNADITSYSGNEVQLGVTYHISVYATKAGYKNSETVTATLCWIDADPIMDGGIENTTIASIRANPVLIQAYGSSLSISGADEGTAVNVYDTAGRSVGFAKASAGTTVVETSLHRGEIGIVKIGAKAVKVVIQ